MEKISRHKIRDDSGYWRWNVNTTWHHFSSLCQECRTSLTTKNEFLKYHHLKAALFFGIGAVESFLNEIMRRKLEKEGESEDNIFKELRYTSFGKKLELWPSKLTTSQISISNDLIGIVSAYSAIRGEVTHPKIKDHSIYRELDSLDINNFTIAVAEFIVIILEAQEEIFPYWLSGWNFVGMGFDPNHPVLLNNQQFLFSLNAFGFNVPCVEADKADVWKRNNMSSLNGFRKLNDQLSALDRCEPKSKRFPYKPRLCRSWWDIEHLQECDL